MTNDVCIEKIKKLKKFQCCFSIYKAKKKIRLFGPTTWPKKCLTIKFMNFSDFFS